MVKSINFSYKSYKEKYYPIIDIEIQNTQDKIWIPVETYVDSGASFSIFSIKDALRVGINYKDGKEMFFTVGDGSVIPVYMHRLHLKIGDVSLNEIMGFSPRLGIGFNLLGQNIFDHFIVIFNNPAKIITFQTLNKQA